ncbi:hypothetical protein BS78_01G179100 [Paspalum vaginatum]|nr:hypothetical protein BS78_01G179100 [Paspalum vaginatum]
MTSRVMRCCLPACARCQGACLLVLQVRSSSCCIVENQRVFSRCTTDETVRRPCYPLQTATQAARGPPEIAEHSNRSAHHSHKTHRASQNGYGFRRSMLGIDQVRLALLVNQERTQPLQSLGGRAVRVATAKM